MSGPFGGHRRFVVVGGAGFIGSHFVDRLLGPDDTERVVVYDNFSSGREWHLAAHHHDPRLEVVAADARDLPRLVEAMQGSDAVIHLASNPDIARAVSEPTIDFDNGTLLSNCVVEAARQAEVPIILYASGSGVYGDVGAQLVAEDHTPMLPISTYGASKLAGEALLASYAFMFGLLGRAFRFANVVGPRQTHGVGHDFIRRLLGDTSDLMILGDGTQSKPYIHVDDVITAVLLTLEAGTDLPYQVFNVATTDHLSVSEIADLAVGVAGRPAGSVTYRFTGGDRGWKGDVPIVRLDSTRIRGLGWAPNRSSGEAMEAALVAMREEVLARAEPNPPQLDARSEAGSGW